MIKFFESSKTYMSENKWTYFCRISELQQELDNLIPIDDTTKYYFTPLKTHNAMPADRTLTLGGMLLTLPATLEYPFSYDDFIEYCRRLPQQELLDSYFDSALSPFYKDSIDVEEISMAKFVSAVNSLIVETDDKWALIDCATNPCKHLEKLRAIVTKVMDIIKARSLEMHEFIMQEMNKFCTDGKFEVKIGRYLRTEINPKNLDVAKVYPSLFSFNGIQMYYLSNTFEFSRLIIGIYINTMYEIGRKTNNSNAHVQLLKMLSDQTRFNILHELCGRQSYGQELADNFGGARSAIYYHLEKLLGYGLVDLEMTEYRMLYTMNKQNVYDKMNAIRDYLLNGWKPEDEPAAAGTEAPKADGESGAKK